MSRYSRFFEKEMHIDDFLKSMEYPNQPVPVPVPVSISISKLNTNLEKEPYGLYTKKLQQDNVQSQLEQYIPEKIKTYSPKESYKKQKIPKSVRTHVWELYIGQHINEHRCLCCKKTLIKITSFDVGHVIAESNGGTLEINNLRPICSVCNHAMQSMNMIDFVKKYGYYI
jgi:5-methylcytosine-specific restriction endonuclease McrA